MNTMQNVEGLDRLPPDVRQQALSSLNTMPSQGANMPLSYNLDMQDHKIWERTSLIIKLYKTIGK